MAKTINKIQPVTKVTGQGVLHAYEEMRNVCSRTEIRELEWVSKIYGAKIVGKFENQQRTGSFKFRGAYYRVKYRTEQKPVIAASAGNHGLAVAEVGKLLGVKTTICIPTTASPLKKERLTAYGHSIIQQGSSLDEAIEYAQELARKFDWDFISPYNDELLITGQGTVAVEFLEQCSDIDTLIIPVGGGGLISGVALAAKQINPEIKIIGVCPEKYPSFFKSFENGHASKVASYPTFADGLAVNLEDESVTLLLGRQLIDKLVLVSEEQIAAATLALLFHESQLIEPSGAVGLAALMSRKFNDTERIGLIFTGSNVSTSNLHKILNYPFADATLFDYINIRGGKTKYQNSLKGVDFSNISTQEDISAPTSLLDTATYQSHDCQQDVSYWSGRYSHIDDLVLKLKKRLEEYVEYCDIEKIKPDNTAVSNLQKTIKDVGEVLTDSDTLKVKIDLSSVEYNRHITEHLQRYRALLHDVLKGSLVLDWRSSSYGQSWDTMFFHVDSQGNPGVNYNRYESNQVAMVEETLANILGANLEQSSLFATSSGMAAYTLIESYLIRNVLNTGDKLYIPHYIYFETEEQVSKLPHIEIIRTETHDTQEIAERIITEKPRVVFLDPITNTVELRMTDIEAVLFTVAKRLTDDVYVVIDGTMLSGQVDIPKLAKISPHIKIFYYDSCSKYLQLGLDIAMGGLVIVPIELQSIFDRLRRNTGTILYDVSANIFPIYDRVVHQMRMGRFSRNAQIVGNLIESDSELSRKVVPHFPHLASHKDYEVAKRYKSVGGLITFSFLDPYLNQRDSLNSFIEIALTITKRHGISLTKGVSFGFSIPRISAATAMAENSPPFLRLSVGDRSYDETILLTKALIEAFKIYINNAKRLMK